MKEEQQIENSGISLVDLINMLLRNFILIVAITISITLIGIIYTFKVVDPTYKSSSDIIVQIDTTGGSGSSTTDYDLTNSLRIITTVSEYLKNGLIINAAIDELGLDMTAGQILKNLTVSYTTNSSIVTVSYESTDPVLTKRVVNAIITNAIDIANTQYPILSDTMYQMLPAEDGNYASPNKMLNVVISFLLGAIVGVGSALLIEAFKTTVRNKKELEQLLPHYQVIGVIPMLNGKGE
ncbi:MAG: Wzz/FepE/Etk N-terminal domain-containing protein [Bacilli bacterium]|jgi:capsular polysaccharide biosynthesis protein|nr:Wzz/FepE/Etk N-terminal domain-containing protein [Bacilli bacterium]